MVTTSDWLTQPQGLNRPKIKPKKTQSSYYQGSPEGDANMTKSIESKMQEPENRFRQHMTLEDMINAMPNGHIDYTANRVMNQIKDAQGVLRQLPDVGLAANIIVSAIVNAGLQTSAITYNSNLEKTLVGLTEPLLKTISDACEDKLLLKKSVPRWVHDALIEEGAKAILILPETTIDHTINSDLAVGLEAYDKQYKYQTSIKYGAIGAGDPSLNWPANEVAGLNDDTKSIVADGYNILYQRFIDNPEALKLSRLKTKQVADKFAELYLKHMPGYGGYQVAGLNRDGEEENPFAAAIRDQKNGNVTLKKSYHTERSYRAKPVDMLRDPSTVERPNIGYAVPTVLPKESITPIFDPSDPTIHIAYIITLDENNKPVSRLSSMNRMRDDYQSMAQNDSLPSLFIRQADQAMNMNANQPGGKNNDATKYMDYQSAFDLYTTIVWNDWKKRIENGVLGTSYSVAKPESLLKLLFEMTLRKKQTQMLVVPASLMTYFAYNYDDVGVGESLIEISKSLASLRIVLLYSQTNMEFQASIPRRRLNMKIDPREPDKQAAVKMLYNNWILNQQTMLPINVIDPVSINQSIWRQAVEVNVESDPRFPNTTLEVETIEFDKREPDANLSERLQKLHDMGFGLTPEQIDTSLGDDRVTSRLLNNEMFRQRVTTWKDITDFHLTDLIRKFVLNSEPLMTTIRETFKKNQDAISKTYNDSNGTSLPIDIPRLAYNFVMGITVNLPNIEEEGIDDTEKKFTEYDEFLDKVLESQFSDDIWQSGDENTRIQDIKLLKGLVKAELIRDWLNERGVLPDVSSITSPTEGGKNISPLINRAMTWIKAMAPVVTMVTGELRAINDSMTEVVPSRGGEIAQENGTSGGGDGSDGFGGGVDDFDMGDGFDMGADSGSGESSGNNEGGEPDSGSGSGEGNGEDEE